MERFTSGYSTTLGGLPDSEAEAVRGLFRGAYAPRLPRAVPSGMDSAGLRELPDSATLRFGMRCTVYVIIGVPWYETGGTPEAPTTRPAEVPERLYALPGVRRDLPMYRCLVMPRTICWSRAQQP